jgi:hypothetical protein
MSVGVRAPPRAWPRMGSRFQVGLWPNTPQKCAGLRMKPPMSLPISRPVRPAASAAADPPEEPRACDRAPRDCRVVP